MKRVAAVGTTGSGKSQLAHRLDQVLGFPHIELDALFWQPNWHPAPTHEFRSNVASATKGETWVADGNYTSRTRDVIWESADTIVWLDYPLAIVIWRLLRRTMRRLVAQEMLWNTNKESLKTLLLGRQSLFLWALRTHPLHRREFPRLFRETLRPDQSVVHLHSPREAERWLWSVEEELQRK